MDVDDGGFSTPPGEGRGRVEDSGKHRRPDSHESRWADTPADAMFPAVEDATAMIQRITDNAVPQDVRATASNIDQSGGIGPVVELSSSQQPPTSEAAGMKTASTAGVVRAGAVMAVATVVSRVTGLVSKVAILTVIGAGLTGSAYSVANTLPNIVFELLIGGVLATVAIPLLTRAQRSDPDGGLEYTQRLLTLAMIGLLIATVIAVFCAPLLAQLYLTNHESSQDLTRLTTQLGRLLLPQIFFYGIAALFGAILNTKERFGVNAWAPVLNNVVVIGVAALLFLNQHGSLHSALSTRDVLILGIGTTLGIVMQAMVLIPSLLRSGFRFRWRWGWDPRLSEAGSLIGWAIVYVLVSQVGLVITLRIAAGVFDDDSGPVIFNYASMLFQMPYGIMGVAVLTAIMPRLARHAAAGQMENTKDDVSLATRLSAVALLPISAALIVLGRGLAIVLFNHGAVTDDAAKQIGLTLTGMAVGLVPLAMTMVQMRVFYAVKDGRTPTIINGIMVAVRVPLLLTSVLLKPDLIIPALALSTAVSYIVGAIVGELWLRARFGPMGTRRTLRTVGKMMLASTLAGVAAWGTVHVTIGSTPTGLVWSIQSLLIGGTVGLLVVMITATALRVEELIPLRNRLFGRLRAG